uniref:Uncharacterized protein n=4 Tax=Bradyrhizobium diazoefficiens TaxID=1355477 RepID=A0A809XT14_9BRAD|nr:hypothetical protein XF2B_43630 [Bradyrhizobium diazoefficiens]BCF17664.1 hypothetical protein XF13B_43550 [Bradyrhizobium diazoefficiens]
MMRKVGGPGAPKFVPGHHRPTVYKHLACQKAALREVFHRGRPPPPRERPVVPGGVRHSGAPLREAALQKSRGKRLILEQAGRCRRLPMKRASTSGNFRKVFAPSPATFAMAQALVTKLVPWRMQNARCLENKLKLISFSALCISGRAADMGIPVTTIERVGRTMEAKRFDPRRYRNDEQWSE